MELKKIRPRLAIAQRHKKTTREGGLNRDGRLEFRLQAVRTA
jgi:hypothetical protein